MISSRHKMFLLFVKWIPVVVAAGILLNNTLATFEIAPIIQDILDYLFGNSLAFIILLFACSYIFQFCDWHKLLILYNLTAIIINIITSYITFENISDEFLLLIHYCIAGIFLLIIYNVETNCKCCK